MCRYSSLVNLRGLLLTFIFQANSTIFSRLSLSLYQEEFKIVHTSVKISKFSCFLVLSLISLKTGIILFIN